MYYTSQFPTLCQFDAYVLKAYKLVYEEVRLEWEMEHHR